MARALSDVWVRVLEAGATDGSARSLAKQCDIVISPAISWLRRERENGERAEAQMMFVKFKALLRTKPAKAIKALWGTAGAVMNAFTPDKCANFFTASGYELE